MLNQYNRDPDSPAYVDPILRDIYGELQKVKDIWEGKTAWYKLKNFYSSEKDARDRYSSAVGSKRRQATDAVYRNVDWDKANEYLPIEEAETDFNYLNRLKRSTFDRMFRDYIEGDLGGLLSSFTFEGNGSSVEDHFQDVDGRGNSLPVFLAYLDALAARDGMVAILTDTPRDNDTALRAHWTAIERCNLTGYMTEKVGAEEIITQARIRFFEQEPEGEYGSMTVEKYLILEPGQFQVFTVDPETKILDLTDKETLSLDYIPLTLYSLNSLAPYESDIPLLDYADLNIEHYQVRSEQREAIHLTNCPPLQVNRMAGDLGDPAFKANQNEAVIIGPYAVIRDRECKWVESTGHGISHTKDYLAEVKEQMKAKGLAFITGLQSIRTATEVELDASQVEARLQVLAQAKESAFESMATHWADLMGESEIASISLDRELISNLSKLSAKEIIEAMEQRTFSREFGLNVLNKNKAFGDTVSQEDIDRELARTEGVDIDRVDEEVVVG